MTGPVGPTRDMRISTVFDDGVAFDMDVKEFFRAVRRAGVPEPSTRFSSYPKWAAIAFASGGVPVLRWAFGASDADREGLRAAVLSACRLGGQEAAKAAALAFIRASAGGHA